MFPMASNRMNSNPNGQSNANASRVFPMHHGVHQGYPNPQPAQQHAQQQQRQPPAPFPMCYGPPPPPPPLPQPIRLSQQILACGCIAYIPVVQQQPLPPVAMLMQQVPIPAQQPFGDPMNVMPPAPIFYGLPYPVAESPPQPFNATPQLIPLVPPNLTQEEPIPVEEPETHYAQNNASPSHSGPYICPMCLEER